MSYQGRPWLPMAARGCPWLPLPAPGCPGLPLAAPGCPWLPLATPGCPWLPLAAPGGPWLPLAAPGCPSSDNQQGSGQPILHSNRHMNRYTTHSVVGPSPGYFFDFSFFQKMSILGPTSKSDGVKNGTKIRQVVPQISNF